MSFYDLISGDSGVLAAAVMVLFSGVSYIISRIELNRKYYKKVIILFLSKVICEIEFLKSIPSYRKKAKKYIYETMEFGKKYRKFEKHHEKENM